MLYNFNLMFYDATDYVMTGTRCNDAITFVIIVIHIMNIIFELMLYVPVNIKGHAGTLSPFYGTFTQH